MTTALLLFCLTPATPARTNESDAEFSNSSHGAYCGVYCLSAALAANGLHAPLEGLIDVRYVSSFAGSSAADLVRAAEDHRATAHVLSGLSGASLLVADCPLILHVRKEGFGNPYAHWILFLGIEHGKARILDPPQKIEHWELADVLACWDGIAVALPRQAITRRPFVFFDLFLNLMLCGSAFALLKTLQWTWRRITLSARASFIIQLSGIAGIVGLLAMVWHVALPFGYPRNPIALALVRSIHYPRSFETIDYVQLQSLMNGNAGNVILVDVRFPDAFAAGHIPQAVNVPVVTHLQDLRKRLRFDSQTRYILYCHAKNCVWADLVANKLAILGVRNVQIYRNGFTEWRARQEAL
jgi:rhodanese-related sulfurtransferase